MALGKMVKRMMESPEFKRAMGQSGAAKGTGPSAGDMKAAEMVAEKKGPLKTMNKPRRGFRNIKQAAAAAMAAKPAGMKKGGMADKSGRAMTRKTADTKGRAMKKGK
jgi:hypothetical protein